MKKSNRHRILFVNGTAWGGSLSSTRLLATALRELGADTFILSRSISGDGLQPWLHKRLENLHARLSATPLRPVTYALSSMPGATPTQTTPQGPMPEWQTPVPGNACRRLAKKLRPNVVVVASVLRPQWRKIRLELSHMGIPTVFYLREDTSLEHLDAQSPPDAVLANSEALRHRARSRGFPCGFVPSPITPPSPRYEGPRTHALVVNFAPAYGGSIALSVAQAAPEIPFVFQDSWNMATLRIDQAVKSMPRRNMRNVEIRPFQSDTAAVYRGARALLVPYQEQFASARPRSVLEAMSCGIPVLASDLPGLREAAGDAAVYVRTGASVNDWVAALRSLWCNEILYRRLAQKALDRFSSLNLDGCSVAERFLVELEKARLLPGRRLATPSS